MVRTSFQCKGRMQWIDSARGIAMLSVILGHMNIGNNLKHVIFSFHMPFFFLLSGYFLRLQGSRRFIKSKAKHLLIPYVFTGICLILFTQILNMLKMIVHKGNIYPASRLFLEWIKAILLGSGGRTDFLWIHSDIAVGAIWFLPALFFAQCSINFLLEKKFGIVFILGIASVGIITAKNFWLPWSLQPATVASVFIMFGTLFAGGGYTLYNLVINKSAIVTCMMLWTIYLGLCICGNKHLSIASVNLPWGLMDFLGATAASVVVLWFSYRIIPAIPMLERFLSWFGKNSLIVLCFHLIELTCIPIESVIKIGLSLYGIKSWYFLQLLTFIVKIIWSCCAIFIVKRNNVLSIIFGNKSG